MTNEEIFSEFRKKFPDIKFSDYRPLCVDAVKEKQGITIWLSNGDIIFYFPDTSEKARWTNKREDGSVMAEGFYKCSNCGHIEDYYSTPKSRFLSRCPSCKRIMEDEK